LQENSIEKAIELLSVDFPDAALLPRKCKNMQNVLVFGDKRTTITESGCQHISLLHTCTWYDCEILIVFSSMMVSNDDAKADD